MSAGWASFVPWNLIHDQRVSDTESDRISNEEYTINEQRADQTNRNEIGRQTEFLKGMTPVQADQYNLYQDQTYGADTARQIQRTKDTAAALGMSPWELNGGTAANPNPSPVMGNVDPGSGSKAPGANAPALIAQFQARNQLRIAKLQAATQLATTAMQTGNATKIAGMQTNDGEVARAQTELTRMQTRLSETTDAKTRSEILLQIVREIKGLLPTYENNLQFFKENGISGHNTLAAFLMANSMDLFNEEAREALYKMAKDVPTTKMDTDVTEMIGLLKAGSGVVKDIGAGIGSFLKGFGLKNHKITSNVTVKP